MHDDPATTHLRRIPLAITTFRLLLAPFLVGLAWRHAPGWSLAMCLTFAFWADVLDGVVARRLGVSTPWLRQYDSRVDVVFYLAVLVAIRLLRPEVLAAIGWHVAALVGLEIVAETVCWLRFRQSCGTHTWLCKAWGVVLWLASVEILGLGRTSPLITLAVVLGYVAYGEVILIHLLARRQPVDLPSVWHLES